MKIAKTLFAGQEAIEIKTNALKAVILIESGPRIAFWGMPGGKNLLFWDSKVLSRNDWKLKGGHRVWATRPGADESEDAYRPDNNKCEVSQDENSITFTAPIDPVLRTQRGFTLKVLAENTLQVDNFVTNAGDMLYSCGVWALTCTNPLPGRSYGIPLGNGSDWDSFNLIVFRSWGGHNSPINDSQISFSKDMLLLNPQGIESKRMLEVPYGIMAMNAPDQDTTFIKKFDYNQDAVYPRGCNAAFYVGPDNFMVELESMGPEITLPPGRKNCWRETWLLTDKAIGADNSKTLRTLF